MEIFLSNISNIRDFFCNSLFQIIVISGLSCEDYKLCSRYGDDQEFKVLDWITLNVGQSPGFTLYLLVSAQIWTVLLSFYPTETLRRITDIAAWSISTCFMDQINKIPTENQQDPGNSTLSRPAGWWDYISKYLPLLTPAQSPAEIFLNVYVNFYLRDRDIHIQ